MCPQCFIFESFSVKLHANPEHIMINIFVFLSSLMTVLCSCPIMVVTWTWSLPWMSRKMNLMGFKKTEGKKTSAFYRHYLNNLCIVFYMYCMYFG